MASFSYCFDNLSLALRTASVRCSASDSSKQDRFAVKNIRTTLALYFSALSDKFGAGLLDLRQFICHVHGHVYRHCVRTWIAVDARLRCANFECLCTFHRVVQQHA